MKYVLIIRWMLNCKYCSIKFLREKWPFSDALPICLGQSLLKDLMVNYHIQIKLWYEEGP